MAGLIRIKEGPIVTSNPESGSIFLGVDISDNLIYTKDSAGVVTKFPTLGDIQNAVDNSGHQEELVSGTNIKTVAGQSLLGSGAVDLTSLDTSVSDRARANHTGTQLASTVIDFEDAVKRIFDTSYSDNYVQQVNNTTTPAVRESITKTPLHSGAYYVETSFSWTMDSTTANFRARLLVDGVVINSAESEPQDSIGVTGGVGADHKYTENLNYVINATAGTPFTVVLDFVSQTGYEECAINWSICKISRMLENV